MEDAIRCRWTGEAFEPLGAARAWTAEALDPGEIVAVTVERMRSMRSHRHQFAAIREAWDNLPERLAGQPWARSAETMRKHALIASGYCDTVSTDCGSKAAAERVMAMALPLACATHGYAVGFVRGPVFVLATPESQSTRTMGAERFQRSKDAVLAWIEAQFGWNPLTGEVAA